MAIYTTFEEVELNLSKEIVLRKEQEDAIRLAKQHFGKTKRDVGYTLNPNFQQFLWNAKMRFGKTLCALELAKQMNVRRILIVTHRPAVNQEWIKAFKERFSAVINNYNYGTKSDTQSEGDFYALDKKIREDEESHFVFFASMQYLRRSHLVGGNDNDKLKADILNYNWDFVIVDEAHEGTRTDLGQHVIELLKFKTSKSTEEPETKMLHLSGTPFNLYEDFGEKEIYTWDYVMEQTAKDTWPRDEKEKKDEKEGKPNPYAILPKMKIYTFDLSSVFTDYKESEGVFKFSEFFRVKSGSGLSDTEQGKFVNEELIKEFLVKLRTADDTNNFPYSTKDYRNAFRHTLWIVPGVKEAKALKDLLEEDDVFKKFKIINVAGKNGEEEQADNALDAVLQTITDQPDQTRTITLSCGKLTTGTTVSPWTAVLYLKGSEGTKASTYMQTIFRVQSPCIMGTKMKKECYVFDFSPFRTLKVVAETAKYSTIAQNKSLKAEVDKDKSQEEIDKENMDAFVKLCPIHILGNASMKEYDANNLFAQLEHVYIDRLVLKGFNDDCLYNKEELRKISKEVIEDIGKRGGDAPGIEKRQKVSDIDMTSLTEEEKQQLAEAERKKKEALAEARKKNLDRKKAKEEWWNSLSPEEQNAILKERERKSAERKEAREKISNIRGIALRIPLLMFGGADKGDPNEDLTVDNFTRKISYESWKEFMPKDIEPEDFNAIKKAFKATRFMEAGKKYRALAKEADSMHINDRIQRITEIHSWFHNPDQETVLTPWRVVNMHMNNTLGGYRFFNETFDGPIMETIEKPDGTKEEVISPNPVFENRGEVTDKIFKDNEPDSTGISIKILEINSKTGLYPLYVAYSLYRTLMDKYIANNTYKNIDNLSVKEEQDTWDIIVKSNLFVLCNTTMAERITYRTLMGFRGIDKHNIKTIRLVERARGNKMDLINELKSGKFWGLNDKVMYFNAIVGNPPYQISDKGDAASDAAAPIYQHFVEIAKSLEPSYISIIMQSKWMVGGRTELDPFRETMKEDCRLQTLVDFEDDRRIFPTAHNDGGICYFLWDKNKKQEELNYIFYPLVGDPVYGNTLKNKYTKYIIRNSALLEILDKIGKKSTSLKSIVSKTQPFGIRKDVFNNPEKYAHAKLSDTPFDGSIKIYGVKGFKGGAKRTSGFITKAIINDKHNAIDKYKLFFTTSYSANATVAPEPIKGLPNEICTETFLLVGPFKNKEEMENCYKYMHTNFFRFLLYYGHGTMQVNKDVFSYIPMVDFSKTWDDEKLYTEFGINSKKYIDLIENVLKK